MKEFVDTDELKSYILENYKFNKTLSEDFIGVSVVAHYPIMINLVNHLIKNSSFKLENVELSDPDVDGYCDEYVLTLDDNGKIWIQKAVIPKNKYDDDSYVTCEEDLILVHEDVNFNKFLISNSEENIVVFSIKNKASEDNAEVYKEDHKIECDARCTKDNNYNPSDNLHGFTFSENDDSSTRSFSFWCTEKLEKGDYIEIISALCNCNLL